MSEKKLQERLAELQKGRSHAVTKHDPKQLADVEQHMRDAPLIHGTSLNCLNEIWANQALDSRKKRGKKALVHQSCFNTYDAVYTSIGVMYPQRQMAFVFSPTLEGEADHRFEASPWDSGAFYKQAASLLGLSSDAERKDFFNQHTLPAPLYRPYLIEYIASTFKTAEDYFRRQPYSHPDPGGVMVADPENFFLRVFEVRVFPKLPLKHIQVVFLPSVKNLPKPVREKVLPELRRANIPIEYYAKGVTRRETNPTPADLQHYVTEWMCNRAKTTVVSA